MIGNDIVDLVAAKRESNWQRRGFLDKVFTTHEQHLIQTASYPDTLVWQLWTLKESAYKLAVRYTQKREFAPKKIACFLNEPTQGSQTGCVVYGVETYATKSIITAQYIATVAFRAGTSPTYRHVIVPFDTPEYAAQNNTIRECIKQDCSVRLAIPQSSITIQKNKVEVPELIVDDLLPMPVTISHHGYYGAYGIPF